jgi:LmbE family N-acetylglucosaminyl deacetylase
LKTVLAVFAHPDDAELTCFGTLGLLKNRGYRVLVGILTDGLAGSVPTGINNRVAEAEGASAVMGFELLRGALPDGDLQYSSQLIMQIENWVRDYEPAIVITHDYDPSGIDHQDHIAVARAVLNVVHRKPQIELLLKSSRPVARVRSSLPLSSRSGHSPQKSALRSLATKHSCIRTTCSPRILTCDRAGGLRFPACRPPLAPEARYTSKRFESPGQRYSRRRRSRSASRLIRLKRRGPPTLSG